MAGKRLAFHVTVDGEDGPVTFGPSDTVPGWAKKLISNPGAWDDGDDDAAADADSDNEPGTWDPSMKVPELQAAIDARNEGRSEEGLIVPEGKKKDDLIAALEADDARSA